MLPAPERDARARPARRSRAVALTRALVLMALPLGAGCRACDRDHPFVPYRIEGGVPAPASSSSSAAVPSASSSGGTPSPETFAREPALVAPPHATTWTVGTLALTSPPGAVFKQGLAWDVDGDGHDDALVLAELVDEAVHEGLYFYKGSSSGTEPPVRVQLLAASSATPPLVLDPRCTRVERLARVGKRSASVEIGQTCPKEVAGLGFDREVALVSWSGGMRARVAFPVLDPPGAQTLSFELDGTDVDGDGLDDATLRVSLEGGEPPFEPGPAVHALFRWFDRPAGLSREAGEPERSLHALAAQAAAHATKPKEAATALSLAAAGRFLFQAICAESPVRRVAPQGPRGAAESPLACEAGHALEELGLAETRAYVTSGDVLRAIASLDASELPPSSRTAAKVTEATAWITGVAPVVQATEVRAIGAVPRLGTGNASWGALRFEASGQVLVRTLAGVVRVDPVHGDESDAAGVVAWPTKVASPDGRLRLDGVYAPCRGVALEALLTANGADGGSGALGGDATLVPLPVEAPLAPRCASGTHEPVAAVPIAWGAGGLELLAAGEPVLIPAGSARASPLFQLLGQPVAPGSPRSPDGATLVVPTSQGILVRGAKARLLRAKELDRGYGELRDCAVSDDGTRVACVRGGVAFAGVWPAP